MFKYIFIIVLFVALSVSIPLINAEVAHKINNPMIDFNFWFFPNLAFEKENIEDMGGNWQQIKKDYFIRYNYPLQYFENLITVDTFLKLNDLSNKYILQKSDKNKSLERLKNLPFPIIWKILDREKSIRLPGLNRFCFDSKVLLPSNVNKRDAIISLQSENEWNTRLQDKKQKNGINIPEDVLLFVKIAFYKKIGEFVSEEKNNCPIDWRDRIIRELKIRFKKRSNSIEDWYIKEAIREALELSKTELNEEENILVWETKEFAEWWKKHGDGTPIKN